MKLKLHQLGGYKLLFLKNLAKKMGFTEQLMKEIFCSF